MEFGTVAAWGAIVVSLATAIYGAVVGSRAARRAKRIENEQLRTGVRCYVNGQEIVVRNRRANDIDAVTLYDGAPEPAKGRPVIAVIGSMKEGSFPVSQTPDTSKISVTYQDDMGRIWETKIDGVSELANKTAKERARKLAKASD